MQFLIPSAKQLAPLNGGRPIPLSPASQVVVDTLAPQSVTELARFYGVSEEQAQTEAVRWQALANQTARSWPAADLYDGLMYRQFKPVLQTEVARHYAQNHVWIATALYGLVPAMTPIAPHRLDFMKTLRVDVDGRSLKAHWQAQYDAVLADQDTVVVSLLSSEFEQVFSPAVRRRFLRLQFLEADGERLKKHSTISKKGRGQLLAYCLTHQVDSLATLQAAQFDGYRYDAALSTECDWVYVRRV